MILATFRERPNRFLGVVDIRGEEALCFIPNPGRMEELFHPGSKVYLMEMSSEARKTRYDLILVDLEGILISVDSRIPNRLVAEGVQAGKMPELQGLRIEKREPTFDSSRLDFLLTGDLDRLHLEVKSCTLVKNGTGFFPDAPTARGSRHLKTLARSLTVGRAALLFVIQRPDARSLRPNDATDPGFGQNLREVKGMGVEVYAYNSEVTLEGVSLNQKVPVLLNT
ncbi:MAG: DNA/RNA nuclease SfsA [Candidatus Bathyarchaeia archaeon]